MLPAGLTVNRERHGGKTVKDFLFRRESRPEENDFLVVLREPLKEPEKPCVVFLREVIRKEGGGLQPLDVPGVEVFVRHEGEKIGVPVRGLSSRHRKGGERRLGSHAVPMLKSAPAAADGEKEEIV